MKDSTNPVEEKDKKDADKRGEDDYRVLRGGGWYNRSRFLRVTDHNYNNPWFQRYDGFRLVKNKGKS
jgi:formylglycine-generating enzyme required for sulfatase activity